MDLYYVAVPMVGLGTMNDQHCSGSEAGLVRSQIHLIPTKSVLWIVLTTLALSHFLTSFVHHCRFERLGLAGKLQKGYRIRVSCYSRSTCVILAFNLVTDLRVVHLFYVVLYARGHGELVRDLLSLVGHDHRRG